VAEADQAQVLVDLVEQDELSLAFYGDDLNYRYAKVVPHDEQQRNQLDSIVVQARHYWEQLESEQRDFDLAKAAFMCHFI
jgi:hypothetical protein